MFAKLSYYAHSAQDELGNLLPYEYWQTLQSHSVNVGEMAAGLLRGFVGDIEIDAFVAVEFHLGYLVRRKLLARRDSFMT